MYRHFLSILFVCLIATIPELSQAATRDNTADGTFLSKTRNYGHDMVKTAISATNHMTWVSLKNKSSIPGTLSQHGWVLAGSIIEPSAGGRGYVAYHKKYKKIVIAFRGSKGAKGSETRWNVAVDANVRLKKLDWLGEDDHPAAKTWWRKQYVHAGFNNEYKRFRSTVLSQVKSIPSYKQYDIFVIGFSLGSALATHAALDVKLSLEKTPYVYIGGTPRVGSRVFMNLYEKEVPNIFRIVLRNDIVARVPVKAKGYAHIGSLLPLKPNGQRLTKKEVKELHRARPGMAQHNYALYKKALVTHLHKNKDYPKGLLKTLGALERQ